MQRGVRQAEVQEAGREDTAPVSPCHSTDVFVELHCKHGTETAAKMGGALTPTVHPSAPQPHQRAAVQPRAWPPLCGADGSPHPPAFRGYHLALSLVCNENPSCQSEAV